MNTDSSLQRARLCALVSVLLFIAVLIVGGIRSATEKPASISIVYTPEYEIASFAVERNTLRRDELERLQRMVADVSLNEDIRADAAQRMMRLQEWMEQEACVRDVLSARGYELPVITVHDDSVNVVLRADALSREEAQVILELVMRETHVNGGNVKIIPIN